MNIRKRSYKKGKNIGKRVYKERKIDIRKNRSDRISLSIGKALDRPKGRPYRGYNGRKEPSRLGYYPSYPLKGRAEGLIEPSPL